MASFSYLHTLKMYKKDIVGGDLYFNQVGSCCHKSERVTISIKSFQKNLVLDTHLFYRFISKRKTLGNPRRKINKYKIRFLPEMSKKLVYLWNRISKIICKNLVADFENKI